MNSLIGRKITITTAWQALSANNEIVSGTITAPSTNTGNVSLEGDLGDEIPLEPGEWHELPLINLANIRVKGTSGDIITVVGGVL